MKALHFQAASPSLNLYGRKTGAFLGHFILTILYKLMVWASLQTNQKQYMKKIKDKYECIYIGERGLRVPCHLQTKYVPWSKNVALFFLRFQVIIMQMLISGHACQKIKKLLNWRRFSPLFFFCNSCIIQCICNTSLYPASGEISSASVNVILKKQGPEFMKRMLRNIVAVIHKLSH